MATVLMMMTDKSRRHNVAVAKLARLGGRDLIQPRQFIKRRLVASCSPLANDLPTRLVISHICGLT
jgi:hypothetical protein